MMTSKNNIKQSKDHCEYGAATAGMKPRFSDVRTDSHSEALRLHQFRNQIKGDEMD
jgi:hypothetical protein